jgi:1-deoxy-D-xylulose-5-phosphate reductoisomerase
MRRVALLGVTGSIGRQALEIVEAHADLELVAAASGSQAIDGLAPLTQVGGDLTALLERSQPDIVLNAVVGFAGLPATLWALERGVDLALANKESLVAAGELALEAQRRGGGRLLPVDSEHSAAFQCLEGRDRETVHSLVLTASGGPFRGRSRDKLAHVTPAQALAHPTWNMGPKITVDSATLANKGLELIEAHFLFGLPYERIEVIVHPTSLVHALVRLRDGAALAHLGFPDMRVPISFALTYPERARTPVEQLDLAGLTLEFEEPDLETFPLLTLGRRAGELGGTFPCAYNAANEVAVAAFLAERLPFPGIAAVVEETLRAVDGAPARALDDLVEADSEARRLAAESAASSGARGAAGKGGKRAGRRTNMGRTPPTGEPGPRGTLRVPESHEAQQGSASAQPPAASGGSRGRLRRPEGAAGQGREA